MINPISKNHTNTIGLCEAKMPDSEYIGKFDIDVLIEWSNKVAYNHGHQQVYLYCHKSENPATSAKSLAASDEYDGDMFTIAVGCEDKEDIEECKEKIKC